MTYPATWQSEVSAARLTSMQCGGSIRYLATPRTMDELQEAVRYALENQLPYKLLSGGSNLIFSDAGFAGVVIQPQFTEIFLKEAEEFGESITQLQKQEQENDRYRQQSNQYLSLQEQEEGSGLERLPWQVVEMGAGVAWGQAVHWTLQHALHGLHRYARIPCKVGGAVYNNIHAQNHLLSEHICAVRVLNPQSGEVRVSLPDEVDFSYDHSRFHTTDEIIISAIFALPQVEADRNQQDIQLYRDWTAQKVKAQPSGANAGSVFKNLTPEAAAAHNQTAVAAGWFVEQAGFKGERVGGMQVFPHHANFIINTGDGTQADLITLVQKIRRRVYEQFGLWLEPEIECIDEVGKRMVWESSVSA